MRRVTHRFLSSMSAWIPAGPRLLWNRSQIPFRVTLADVHGQSGVLANDLVVEGEKLRTCRSTESVHYFRAPSLDQMSQHESAPAARAVNIRRIAVNVAATLNQ
jgi:hypothetical protein